MTDRSRSIQLAGLYVILDPAACADRPLLDILKQSATSGAMIFQYRNKTGSMKAAYAEALQLRRMAKELGALFIVNDRCDLALAIDADGVHLGQEDLSYIDARKVVGPRMIIGLSTHNADQVREAERVKPDYIGFGPIYKPGSKEDHDPIVGVEGLRAIRPLTSLPIFAIGGIAVHQVGDVIRAGANGVAIVSAIMKAPDVARATQELISQLS